MHLLTFACYQLFKKKTGANIVLPPKTLFRGKKKEKEVIVGLSMAKY